MAKPFKRGDAVGYQPKTDDMRDDGRSAAFYERGTTFPLKPLLWWEYGLRSLRATPRSAWRLRRGGRILNSKRLTCQRGGKIDGLTFTSPGPIEEPRPLLMLFRVRPNRALSDAPQTLRKKEAPKNSADADLFRWCLSQIAERLQTGISPDSRQRQCRPSPWSVAPAFPQRRFRCNTRYVLALSWTAASTCPARLGDSSASSL
jgi:hypothetical protein